MIQRPLLGAGILLAMLAGACTSPPPDGQQKTPEGPQFDADYYSKNAKEYFGDGRYGQAKDQWQKQLQKDPDNWMAHLGIAYCDLFLARQAPDPTSVRALVTAAEKRFRGLWSGQVEADTMAADPKRPEWKAAMGLALSTRTLGYLDQVESKRSEEVARKGGPDASKAIDRAVELQLSRDRHYQDAIAMFHQLAHMQHASPEAIRHLGELYIVTKQDALAEQEFRRYLDLAAKTRTQLEKGKQESGKFGPDKEELAIGLFDEKLESNAQKQVSVIVGLAELAWTRADYLNARQLLQDALKIQPERKDLYLKLAEVEDKLDMQETALMNVNEFLKRSSANRQEFDKDIQRAMKLRQELDQKLRSRQPAR
jgi:Tfp pilus assembly protein PilF